MWLKLGMADWTIITAGFAYMRGTLSNVWFYEKFGVIALPASAILLIVATYCGKKLPRKHIAKCFKGYQG